MNVSVIESRGQSNTSSSDAVGVLFVSLRVNIMVLGGFQILPE